MNKIIGTQALYKQTAGCKTPALELKTKLLESTTHHPADLLKFFLKKFHNFKNGPINFLT